MEVDAAKNKLHLSGLYNFIIELRKNSTTKSNKVEETAGCSGDYLQFGRDTFIITDRQSPKFCNKVIFAIVCNKVIFPSFVTR